MSSIDSLVHVAYHGWHSCDPSGARGTGWSVRDRRSCLPPRLSFFSLGRRSFHEASHGLGLSHVLSFRLFLLDGSLDDETGLLDGSRTFFLGGTTFCANAIEPSRLDGTGPLSSGKGSLSSYDRDGNRIGRDRRFSFVSIGVGGRDPVPSCRGRTRKGGWILGSSVVTCTEPVCPTWRTSDTKWNTKLRRRRGKNERSRTAKRIQVRDIQEQTKGAEPCVWHWTDERDGTRPTHPRWLYTSERIQHNLPTRVETRHTTILRWEKITTKSWGCKKEPAKTK